MLGATDLRVGLLLSAITAADSHLSDIADRYHLWPWVILFLFCGILGALGMAIRYSFRFLEDVHDAFYEFKKHCADNKRRYEQGAEK